MARLPDAFIDDLLARTDLVEVISARVPLKRQGREYSARCPFHDERSPSFTVSPIKQFYHCFGCGAHGTAISFLVNYDRLEFLDAVEELAKRAGVEVPRDTRVQHEQGDTRDLHAILEAAASFFQQQLAGNATARQYLQKRGVDVDTQTRFGIGYAPDGWDALKSALGTDARQLALLDKAGLLSKSESGRVYDKFRSRVMFPIHDRRGRVIAFGGRVLEAATSNASAAVESDARKDHSPKYLNSPETALFHKGRELYALWQVRQAHSKIERLIVVEGYMDVVALFQHGIDSAVATLGTATTPDHAELLFRNAADVVFCFDGDRAGRGAAWKALESALPRMRDGRQAFFLFLPDGEDPDSIVRKEGAAGLDARLAEAVPLSEFLFNEIGRDVNRSTLDGRARLAERAKPLLAQLPDGAFADLMRQRLSELTGVPQGLGEAKASGVPSRVAPPRSGRSHVPKRSLVRGAIALLLQSPAIALDLPWPCLFAALRQPGIELLVELIALVRERPEITTGALLEHFTGRDEAAALQKLAVQTMPGDPQLWQREWRDALAQLDQQTLRQRLAELQALQGQDGLDADDKRELLELMRMLART
ncbi:MAG: DNA primase [Lysobacteraceae bacterium]